MIIDKRIALHPLTDFYCSRYLCGGSGRVYVGRGRGEKGRAKESERATKAKIRRQFPSVFWPYPSQSEEITQCYI